MAAEDRSKPLEGRPAGVSDSQCLSARDAFLGAPAARRLPRFPVSLVSTAGPRALPLPARCGTQLTSRHWKPETPRSTGRRLSRLAAIFGGH